MGGKALVVSTDGDWRIRVSGYARSVGWEVVAVASAEKAIEIIDAAYLGEYKLIITDQDLGKQLSGPQVIERARERFAGTVTYVLYYTGSFHTDWADIFLSKRDFSSDVLLAAIGRPPGA